MTISPGEQEEQDRRWMQRALALAEKSVGRSSPNPSVGCVLVVDSECVGEGFHEYDKRDHAEIVALKQAGERARGATAYVTLEPCSHHGRTGPCADALLSAGIGRVVAATRDPNPIVHGEGIRKLLAGGVKVTTGVLEAEARRVNDAFAKFTQSSSPFVTMKVASSLDGRIAPPRRTSKSPFWITGETARAEVHRMRHAADALLTGVGTILADDPLLTDRSNLPRRRPLLRVVLDSTLRIPIESQLVTSAKDDVLIFFTHASHTAQAALEGRGIKLERLPSTNHGRGREHVSLQHALDRLGELGMTSVLAEAGAEMNSALLNGNHVDKLVLFYAPTFLGHDAVPMFATGIRSHRMNIASINPSLRRLGEDFAVEAYLHDPWASLDD